MSTGRVLDHGVSLYELLRTRPAPRGWLQASGLRGEDLALPADEVVRRGVLLPLPERQSR